MSSNQNFATVEYVDTKDRKINSDILKFKADLKDFTAMLGPKIGKFTLTQENHEILSVWSFSNIKVCSSFSKTYYDQVVFANASYILDNVDYSTDFWVNDADHSQGSYGKIIILTSIKAYKVYFNKTTSSSSSVFVRYYNTSGALVTDTLTLPGVYLYVRSVTVTGNNPSFIPISPFFD